MCKTSKVQHDLVPMKWKKNGTKTPFEVSGSEVHFLFSLKLHKSIISKAFFR